MIFHYLSCHKLAILINKGKNFCLACERSKNGFNHVYSGNNALDIHVVLCDVTFSVYAFFLLINIFFLLHQPHNTCIIALRSLFSFFSCRLFLSLHKFKSEKFHGSDALHCWYFMTWARIKDTKIHLIYDCSWITKFILHLKLNRYLS